MGKATKNKKVSALDNFMTAIENLLKEYAKEERNARKSK
ncbi:MAG: hypothetical protein QG628_1095 [Patescibacteria group bacterium]|nr:hypothetical protein [Patescibacteria group bacterium]